eukprot:TRINITY_DN16860_c0_g1_i1.p1 TRINITY_DN16860_c0_g1~~TRINITY_DN16860_c0_g1_i1.p1  ORF type:complete len:153 (-),score=17.23 TRINITY_DN16860_c0_g1_i1:2-460(-)
MFLIALLTPVMSSEYLVRLLIRSQMLLFLGPEDLHNTTQTHDIVSEPSDTDSFFNGSFHLKSSDNFEPYLKEIGVGYFLRQLAMLSFPLVTVSRSCPSTLSTSSDPAPCTWTIKTDAGVKTHRITFQLGKEVEHVTMDGRRIKSIFSMPSYN